MNIRSIRGLTAALLAGLALAACAGDKKAEAPATAVGTATHDMSKMDMNSMLPAAVIPKGAIYTVADVHFMQGMIAHHAQAIFMSRLAVKHGANARLQKFANKIDQSQTTEILLMQQWLARNGQVVPDTSSYHTVMMSGMLSAEQIKQLESSNGADFDKNFLVMMIQHHEGALQMVKDLFAAPLSAQDVDVSVFANDVVTVQTAEIGTMRQMLGPQ